MICKSIYGMQKTIEFSRESDFPMNHHCKYLIVLFTSTFMSVCGKDIFIMIDFRIFLGINLILHNLENVLVCQKRDHDFFNIIFISV